MELIIAKFRKYCQACKIASYEKYSKEFGGACYKASNKCFPYAYPSGLQGEQVKKHASDFGKEMKLYMKNQGVDARAVDALVNRFIKWVKETY